MSDPCSECESIKQYAYKRRCFTCLRKEDALSSHVKQIIDNVPVVPYTPPGALLPTDFTWDPYLVERILDMASIEVRYSTDEVKRGVTPQRTLGALRRVSKKYRARYGKIPPALKFSLEGVEAAARKVATRDCIFKNFEHMWKRKVRSCSYHNCLFRDRTKLNLKCTFVRRWTYPFLYACLYCALKPNSCP